MTSLRIVDYAGSLSVDFSSVEVVRAIASYGLASSAAGPPDAELPPALWGEVLGRVCRSHLTGLLCAAVSDGLFLASEAQVKELRERDRDAQAQSVLLERTAIRVVGLLSQHGIPVAIAGGLAAAHGDYPDPARRPIDEISLLVPGSELAAARKCLELEGWSRLVAEPGRGFDERFGMGLRLQDRGGVGLNLVRTLAPPPYGLAIPASALWEQLEMAEIAGIKVAIPNGSVRLLQACADLVLGCRHGPTIQMRDAAEAIYQVGDPAEVMELARRWQVTGLLAWAVDRVWDELGLAESLWLAAWAQCHEPGGWEKRALVRLRDPKGGYAARALTGIGHIPRTADKIAFARMTLAPDRSYRRGRRWRRLGRLVHLLGHPRPKSTGPR